MAISSPEAEKIWNDHLKHNSFLALSAAYAMKELGCCDKIPQIMEKLIEHESTVLDRKRLNSSLILQTLLDSGKNCKLTIVHT